MRELAAIWFSFLKLCIIKEVYCIYLFRNSKGKCVRAISMYGGIEVKLYSFITFILNAGELSLAIGELRKKWSSSSVWHQGVSRDNLKSDVNELNR